MLHHVHAINIFSGKRTPDRTFNDEVARLGKFKNTP